MRSGVMAHGIYLPEILTALSEISGHVPNRQPNAIKIRIGSGADFAVRKRAVSSMCKPINPAMLRAKVRNFVELYNKSEAVREQARVIQNMNRALQERLDEISRLHEDVKQQKLATEERQRLLANEQAARAQAEQAI